MSYFSLYSYDFVFGEPTTSPLYTSTRQFFDTNTGVLLVSSSSPEPNASSFLDGTNNCPNEIAIYVHGVWSSEESAKEQTERLHLSLRSLNYNNPVIGYTWDSDTSFSLEDPFLSQKGWAIAKIIAHNNGPLLANFITDFKNDCQNTDIRIIAHSLGSRVVLSALESLTTNQATPITNDTNKIIKSVHLLGAAMDNEEVSLNSINGFNNPFPWYAIISCTADTSEVKFAYGKAIEKEVEQFYNIVNSEDNVLQFFYPCAEGGNKALGQSGKQPPPFQVQTPANYHDIRDIEEEIKPIFDANADGDMDFGLCNIFGFCSVDEGDNHAGYIGYRNPLNHNTIKNDGVIDVVIGHWVS
jgi:hypothetical protein